MLEGQYRALVAYLSFWNALDKEQPKFSIEDAMRDIGITDDAQAVIDELYGCLWVYDPTTKTIRFDDGSPAEIIDTPEHVNNQAYLDSFTG